MALNTSLNSLTFTVPDRPVPYVRTTKKQKFVDPRYQKYIAYRNQFQVYAKQAMMKENFQTMKNERIEVNATCYLKGKRRVDVDNLLKSFLDASNKILFDDDSQVVKATVQKVPVTSKTEERVEMSIFPYE